MLWVVQISFSLNGMHVHKMCQYFGRFLYEKSNIGFKTRIATGNASATCIFARQFQNILMIYHPWSYRITISKNPISSLTSPVMYCLNHRSSCFNTFRRRQSSITCILYSQLSTLIWSTLQFYDSTTGTN